MLFRAVLLDCVGSTLGTFPSIAHVEEHLLDLR